MDNRRMTDPHLEEIKERLDAHKIAIEKNAEGISAISVEMKEIKEDLSPWKDAAEGIVIVGKWGEGLRKFGIWLAGTLAALGIIGTAIAGGWDWIQHLGNKQ